MKHFRNFSVNISQNLDLERKHKDELIAELLSSSEDDYETERPRVVERVKRATDAFSRQLYLNKRYSIPAE